MIQIKEVADGYQVEGAEFNQTFGSKLRATLAAYGCAVEQAAATRIDTLIAVPWSWGEDILVTAEEVGRLRL